MTFPRGWAGLPPECWDEVLGTCRCLAGQGHDDPHECGSHLEPGGTRRGRGCGARWRRGPGGDLIPIRWPGGDQV